jgi:hypothetical protein
MKIAVIKKLAEDFNLDQINEFIQLLENGEEVSQEIEGQDEGEKLTHLLGAQWILEQMSKNNSDLMTEWRNFSSRVRSSIN